MPDSRSPSHRIAAFLFAIALAAAVALLLWQWPSGHRESANEAVAAAAHTTAGPGSLATGTAPAAPVQPLAIEGRVLDSRDTPVEGAAVILSGEGGAERRSGPGGVFRFDGLRPGSYFLEAFHEDTAAPPVRTHLDDGSRFVILRLHPAASLDVVVLSKHDDTPIRDAEVEVLPPPERGDEPLRQGTTDASGRVRFRALAPGSYALRAHARHHRSEETYLQPQAGLVWHATLRLVRGAVVTGRVLTRAGAPVPGAVITALPLEIWDAHLSRPRSSRRAVTTDARGEFVYPALEQGAFFLFVTHERFLPGRSGPLSSDGQHPLQGVEVRLDEGATVGGVVLDAFGRPRPFAVVRANTVAVMAPESGLRRTIADERGRFLLAGLPRDEIGLVAQAPDATSEDTVLDLRIAPSVGDLVLRLTHTLPIAGVVTERDGTPVADAQVVCVGQSRGPIGTRPVVPETTDAEGRFACRGLPPGEYALTAMRPYPNNNQSPWMRSAGALAQAGDVDVRIVLPADGSLRGRVLRADGAVPASFGVQVDPGGAPRPFSTRDGSFELSGLAPGPYELRVVAEGLPPATMRVFVPEGGAGDVGTIVLGRQ